MSVDKAVKLGLSNSYELNELINKLKLNLKAIDERPDFNSSCIFDVFHFGSDNPQIGHWILFIKLSNDSCILIDSMGVYHEVIVKELTASLDRRMSKFKNILIVLDQQQNLVSQSCGYYCILNFYLIERGLYKPLNYILIQDGKYQLNDKNINTNRYNKYESIYSTSGLA